MDNRLLFKQKEFENDYAKRRGVPKATVGGHPLRPAKKGAKKDVVINLSIKPSNPLAKLLPHQRPVLPVQQQASAVPTPHPPTNSSMISKMSESKAPEPPKEDSKKLVLGSASPWTAIRGEFIRVYDTRKERIDLFVANPFGSSGLRREE